MSQEEVIAAIADEVLKERIRQGELVEDLFDGLGDCFLKDDAHGQPLYELLQGDWSLFHGDRGKDIIEKALAGREMDSQTLVVYAPEIEEAVGLWDRAKQQLIGEYRYFGAEDLKDSTYIDSMLSVREEELGANVALYRARINGERRKRAFNKKEMGAPPADKATAGRANPMGIPFLYLCDEPETTLYEVRARYLDNVSIAEFCSSQAVKVVDFCKKVSLFAPAYDDNLPHAMASERLAKLITADLSKPMSRYDSEVDYVPTQFLCELIRKTHDVAGIVFNSSLRKGHKNFVLFNTQAMEAKSAKMYTVTSVKISTEKPKRAGTSQL